jgi:hypothetical protein
VTGHNVVVECPGDLASLIVQLHKENPDCRLFLAGFTAEDTVTGTAHVGMTDPPDPAHIVRETTRLVGLLRQWDGTAKVALAAFGSPVVADPYLDLAHGLVQHMLWVPSPEVIDVVRVHAGRYWSYTDDAPAEYARDSEGEEWEPLSDRAIEAATVIARAELGGSS